MNRRTGFRNPIRAWSLALALAALLPFAQFGGLVHALAHVAAAGDAGGAGGADKSPPPAESCDACAGYSAVGGALPVATALAEGPWLSHVPPVMRVGTSAVGARPRFFRSRAPPAPLA